jgi:hypothetical protein
VLFYLVFPFHFSFPLSGAPASHFEAVLSAIAIDTFTDEAAPVPVRLDSHRTGQQYMTFAAVADWLAVYSHGSQPTCWSRG